MAIEYYEGIEDMKYKDYQNRLNLLLSHPDILKKMNEFTKVRRSQSQFQSSSSKQSLDYFQKVKKEQEKIQIKMKVDYMTQLSSIEKNQEHEEHVQKLLESIETKKGIHTAKTKVEEDISKQEESFKERLEKKRARTLCMKSGTKLASKFLSEQRELNLNMNDDESKDNQESNNNNNNSEEEKIEVEENKIKINIIHEEHSFSGEGDRDNDQINEEDDDLKFNDNDNDNDITPIKFDSEKAEKSKLRLALVTPFKKTSSTCENNNLEMESTSNRAESASVDPSPRRNNKEIITTMFQYNESKHIGPKHKQAFLEIKDTIDQYVNEFNTYFTDQIFQRFGEQTQKLMEEKYKKYVEISKNYNSQIKEMEFLIAGDLDDLQKEKIKMIIDSLKEERENELDNIEEHYNMLILNAQSEFKNSGFKTNPGVQLIEEKLMLDMYNLLNGILIPKK